MLYPVIYSIQNDVDKKIIDILFGIPNYRYKIWLLRFFLLMSVSFIFLLLLSYLSSILLTQLTLSEIFYMAFQVFVPIVFFASFTFLLTTIIADGNGTAIVIIIMGLILILLKGYLQQYPEWDIFLNPYLMGQNFNIIVWETMVLNNRIYLLTGSMLLVFISLLNLQNRERFL